MTQDDFKEWLYDILFDFRIVINQKTTLKIVDLWLVT